MRIDKSKDARRRARKAAEKIQIATGVKIVPDRRRKLLKKADRTDARYD